MARKKLNARKVPIDQIAGFCTNHGCILRFKKMDQKNCLTSHCAGKDKCPYLIDGMKHQGMAGV